MVVQSGVHHTCGGGHGRKKNNANKDNLDGPDDGLKVNQNWIWRKTDEVEEDNDETIAILTKDKRLKTRLKDNFVEQLYLTEDIITHVANEISWYAKQY